MTLTTMWYLGARQYLPSRLNALLYAAFVEVIAAVHRRVMAGTRWKGVGW
jgi:hypothetical protein